MSEICLEDFKNIISDVKVYGISESIKASKYPMAIDTNKIAPSSNIGYWLDKENFLNDFLKYQQQWGKSLGKDTKNSCVICGSDNNVQKNTVEGHYYCSKHSHQIERYGECFETKPKYIIHKDKIECIIYGDKRKENIVYISAIDLPILFYSDGLSVTKEGYIQIYNSKNKENELFHRKIFDIKDNNIQIDHIDRNPYNNTRENLRICSCLNNIRNRGINNNNTSGIIGVSWSKERNKWRSYIMLNHKQKFLGYYKELEDAIVARLRAEKEYFGEFAPQKDLFEKYDIEETSIKKNYVDYNKDFKEILRMYEVSQCLGNSESGSGHSNFLKGIVVQFDWKFTPKLSVEVERYHFIDFVSSQSTMHKITKFDLDKAYIKYTDQRCIDIIKEKVEDYNALQEKIKVATEGDKFALQEISKVKYLEILYSNPCGMYLTARMTTNYQQLKTIYQQRRFHRLPEWQDFCDWIETLPYFKELCLTPTK